MFSCDACFHLATFYHTMHAYEGAVVFLEFRAATHIVLTAMLPLSPMIFFDRASKHRVSCIFEGRVPLGPARPQEVSGSLVPAPSPEGVGTVSL